MSVWVCVMSVFLVLSLFVDMPSNQGANVLISIGVTVIYSSRRPFVKKMFINLEENLRVGASYSLTCITINSRQTKNMYGRMVQKNIYHRHKPRIGPFTPKTPGLLSKTNKT